DGKPLRGAVVQSLNVLQTRLCSTVRPLTASHRISGYASVMRPSPTASTQPWCTAAWATCGKKSCRYEYAVPTKIKFGKRCFNSRVARICRATPTSGSSGGKYPSEGGYKAGLCTCGL